MSQNTHIQSNLEDKIEIIVDQIHAGTPDSMIELMAVQLIRAENAKKRIDEEGEVVRDTKGSVIPHPAIKIEQDATKLLHELFKKYAR